MWRDFFTELTTGLRGGMICALQWDNLNPKTGELQVERQVHRVRGELMASPPKTKAWRIRYNNFRKLKSKQKKTWFAALW